MKYKFLKKSDFDCENDKWLNVKIKNLFQLLYEITANSHLMFFGYFTLLYKKTEICEFGFIFSNQSSTPYYTTITNKIINI